MKVAYVAFNRGGKQVADTIEAANPSAAAETLRRQGLFVTQIAPGAADGRHAGGRARRGGKARRLKNLAILVRQLHALVSCGTPMVDALTALERQTKKGPWRDAIADVRSRVEEGASLSAAMGSHPQYFDAVCCSLVAAGESAGNLPAMLDRVAIMTRKHLHIRTTIVGALVYPTLLMGVAGAVLVVLLVLVIPRFGELFKSLDVPLPPTTQAMVFLSHLVCAYWWLAIIGLVVPAVALRLWLATPGARWMLEAMVLRLPQIGRIARSLITARVTRLLGVLLESHVPVLDALTLTRQSVGHHSYAAMLAKAQDAVTSGQPMSTAFGESDLVSPSVCEAIRSGEQSGQVGALLLNIADFLDEENEVIVRSLTSIVEPIILVAMGLVVGVVAISLFMPLFDLTSMVQGGK